MSTLKVWFAGSVLLLLSSQAFAQATLSCWYNPSGIYTGADGGEGTVGSITRTGSGDYAASYLISAFDGTACPRTLPVGATSGKTAYLVKQDSSNCTNDNVVANSSNVGGSVTVFRMPSGPAKVVVSLAGNSAAPTAPNTAYHFFQKCVRILGDVTRVGSGDGGAIFNLSLGQGAPVAFDMYPEGAPAGNKYQSVRMNF